MSVRELKQLLRKHGFKRIKHRGKGSHELWRNEEGREALLAGRNKDTVPPGTLKQILRKAGIPEEEVR